MILLLAIMALTVCFAPTARAEYAFAISFGSGNEYIHKACYGIRCNHNLKNRHYDARRRRNYPYKKSVIYVNTVRRIGVSDRIPAKRVVVALESSERVGISDILVLSKAGISDENIINKINDTGSVFNLSMEEVLALRKEGVSARVINYMLDTAR